MNPVAQVRTIERRDGSTYDALVFWCPGCERPGDDGAMQGGAHMLPIAGTGTVEHQNAWTFNGNLESPTMSPSILTRVDSFDLVCHSFMVDGVMQFLGDCTHKYANQNVPLPPLPDWLVKES